MVFDLSLNIFWYQVQDCKGTCYEEEKKCISVCSYNYCKSYTKESSWFSWARIRELVRDIFGFQEVDEIVKIGFQEPVKNATED